MWKLIIILNVITSLLLMEALANQAIFKVAKGNPCPTGKKKMEGKFSRTMPMTPITDSPLIITASIAEFIKSTTAKDILTINETMATTTTSSSSSSSTTTTTTNAPVTEPPVAATTVNPLELAANTTTTTASLTSPLASVNTTEPFDPYCTPSLCEFYNGTHFQVLPHIACHNPGNFAPTCGFRPHLLHMSNRRRNLILALHNLARSKVASGRLPGYNTASHMPLLKWDPELERLATLHVKRCHFSHDQCRNTLRFAYSGQNIGYYWIEREFITHSRRMKNFIVNWFKEYVDANQTYVDSYQVHPEG
uniref:SCP domain-containing protein n=1 Tax=Stomoxys calcitrans TaxID=35570 RepID=A0A1I8PJE1_STOCA